MSLSVPHPVVENFVDMYLCSHTAPSKIHINKVHITLVKDTERVIIWSHLKGYCLIFECRQFIELLLIFEALGRALISIVFQSLQLNLCEYCLVL